MLVIQCDTSCFLPGKRTGFKCTTCRRFEGFPPDCRSVVILSVVGAFTVVSDAPTGAVLHDCRDHEEPSPPLVAEMNEILRKANNIR